MTSTQESLNTLHAAVVTLVERTPETIADSVVSVSCGSVERPNPNHTKLKEALAVISEQPSPVRSWLKPLDIDLLYGWSTPEGRKRALLGVLDEFEVLMGWWRIRALYDDHGECWVALIATSSGYFEARDKPTQIEAVLSALTQAVESL